MLTREPLLNDFRVMLTLLCVLISAFTVYKTGKAVDELILEVEHWKEVAGCDVTVDDLALNAFICVKK
tara:strand:+ start:1243 stop:1446 length:204 start_codon:yes stop_codon:yes gene_type:complete